MDLRLSRVFRAEQRSLLADVVDWMLTPLLLLWPISLVLTWYVAEGVANKPFDRALLFNVQVVAKFAGVQRVGPESEGVGGLRTSVYFPASAQELLRAGDADSVYYQVLGARGEFVVGERDFPLPPGAEKPVLETPNLRDDVFRGEDLRVAYMWTQLGNPAAPAILVQVGETRSKRATLATEIIKAVMLPQFFMLPLAVVLVWFALLRGLRPLVTLERRMRERRPDDVSPMDEQEVPQEVAPLVNSVNELMRRQAAALGVQKRFLADAAHQLKTPLAGLRMQAELALRAAQGHAPNADAEVQQSLRQIARSSVRATHTVNQLLALARAESSGQATTLKPINLAAVVSDAVRQCIDRALDKSQDLGYDGPEAANGFGIQGQPTLLQELVRNLLDNAIAYCPRGAVITARLLKDGASGVVLLQVEDNGPGIAIEQRETVFEPFVRVLGTEEDGSGLGLSIVREIARLHGATVRIDAPQTPHGHDAPGTVVTVRFDPAAMAQSLTQTA